MERKHPALLLCMACLMLFTACVGGEAPVTSTTPPAAGTGGQENSVTTSRPGEDTGMPQLTPEELARLPGLTAQAVEPLYTGHEDWYIEDPLALEEPYEEVWMEDPLLPYIWVGSRLYSRDGYLVSYKIAKYDEYDPYLSEWVWDGESIYLDNEIVVITSEEYPLACGLQVGMQWQQVMELLCGYSQYGECVYVDIAANRQALEVDSAAVEGAETLWWGQYYPGLFLRYSGAVSLPLDSANAVRDNLCLYFDEEETIAAITVCGPVR